MAARTGAFRRTSSDWVTRTVPLELLDHAIEIGIASTEFPHEPVSTAFGDSPAIRVEALLMRATRLVTLALLFCHVGQATISIFMLFSDLPIAVRQPPRVPLTIPAAVRPRRGRSSPAKAHSSFRRSGHGQTDDQRRLGGRARRVRFSVQPGVS